MERFIVCLCLFFVFAWLKQRERVLLSELIVERRSPELGDDAETEGLVSLKCASQVTISSLVVVGVVFSLIKDFSPFYLDNIGFFFLLVFFKG